jgi:putative glycerol-1-phosphate prenyltransferase
MQLIYLDCGSGADQYASPKLIAAVKNEINVPVIVGGGIKTRADLEAVFAAGADVVVVGTVVEKHPEFLTELVLAKNSIKIS